MSYAITLLTICLIALIIWCVRGYIMGFCLSHYFGIPYPRYSVKIVRNSMMTMKDGVHLFADVYRPKKGGKYPAMIAHTAYEKENAEHYFKHIGYLLAGQGFVFVIQDVRGKRPSEGSYYPHINDASDGADTIDWVINQPWSNGQIALFGFSASGLNSWLAVTHSKHKVTTVIPWFAACNPYEMWYDHGVPYLKQLIFWMAQYAGNRNRKISEKTVDKAFKQTDDWQSLDVLLTQQPIQAYRDFLTHPEYDAFWKRFSIPLKDLKQDIPALLGSGWYDQFLSTTISDFQTLQKSPPGSLKKKSRLIIGPWLHKPTDKIPPLHLGEDANFKHQFALMIHWLQKWMGKTECFEMPPVTYYLMEKNVWCTASEWPPRDIQIQVLYLINKHGLLSHTIDKSDEVTLRYQPHNFVPAIGGHMLFSNGYSGPQEQSFLLARNDVLLWSSAPLERELAVVGAPKLHLQVTTDLPAFDLSIKFIDLFPNGKMQLVTDAYRRFGKEDITLTSFTAALEYIDTAYLFRAGHRIQIAVTHSHFPAHEPNKELFNLQEASVKISSDPESPSFLELPILNSVQLT